MIVNSYSSTNNINDSRVVKNTHIGDLNKKITTLSAIITELDRHKSLSPNEGEGYHLTAKQHEQALGYAMETKKIIDAISSSPKNFLKPQFLECFQELHIKFQLKSIVENPMDWEDYFLSYEIYQNILAQYNSGNFILSESYLNSQNISLCHIKIFKQTFQYNFAANLFYNNSAAPAGRKNAVYYPVKEYLIQEKLDHEESHAIANLVYAQIIAQDSFDKYEASKEDGLLKAINEKLDLDVSMLLIHSGLQAKSIINTAIGLAKANINM